MSASERVGSVLLGAILFSLFYSATKINFYNSQLDSAYMIEIVDTTFDYGYPATRLTKSVIVAIETLLTKPAQQVCAMPLAPESPEFLNVFRRHSFPVLYLTVPSRFIFESKQIVFFLHALSYVAVLFLSYMILRMRGVEIWPSISMVFLVSTHPAWSYSAFGQFYPDKFFPPIGLLYTFLLYERLVCGKLRSIAIIAVALFSMLITERTSLMIGAATIAGLVLYRGVRGWRSDLLLLAIAVFAIAYPLVYGLTFQRNSDYASFRSSIARFLTIMLHNPEYAGILGTFVAVNVLLFGVLAVFEWKLALIAFGAMLPNILGNIGGAEKNGWSTHYHANYFPFLVVAVLLGFAALWQRLRKSRGRYAAAAIPLVLGLIVLSINPFAVLTAIRLSSENWKKYAIWRIVEVRVPPKPGWSPLVASNYYRRIADSIPPRAEVTTNEQMMPSLYGNRLIHFYPLGLGISEYAVLPYNRRPDGGLRFTGAVSYLGPVEQNQLNDCLNDRLRSAGYEVSKLFTDPGGVDGYAVLKLISR